MSRTELSPATPASTLSDRLARVSLRPACFDAYEAQRLVLAVCEGPGPHRGVAREPNPGETTEPVRFTPVLPA